MYQTRGESLRDYGPIVCKLSALRGHSRPCVKPNGRFPLMLSEGVYSTNFYVNGNHRGRNVTLDKCSASMAMFR